MCAHVVVCQPPLRGHSPLSPTNRLIQTHPNNVNSPAASSPWTWAHSSRGRPTGASSRTGSSPCSRYACMLVVFGWAGDVGNERFWTLLGVRMRMVWRGMLSGQHCVCARTLPLPIHPFIHANHITQTDNKQEVKEAHGNIVLFIDEIHLVLGAGACVLWYACVLLSSGGPSDRPATHPSRRHTNLPPHINCNNQQAPPPGRWTRPTSSSPCWPGGSCAALGPPPSRSTASTWRRTRHSSGGTCVRICVGV